MLQVSNLHKKYGPLTAVNGVSFQLNAGDIFGFIGSNGAGKTTTIKMLCTLIEPSGGDATINGYSLRDNPMGIRKQIGYMPDFFGLYDDIKVWEYLDFFANLYKVPISERPGIIDSVLQLTDLTIKKDSFVQSLSRGMQQRLCLARCLVHDPSLLLLDEPASGLDPRARSDLKELILELGRMGKVVIISSHILPELEGFCNVVGIIERGNMLAFGSVSEVLHQVQPTKQLQVRFISDPSGIETALTGCELILNRTVSNQVLTLDFTGDDAEQAEILKRLVLANVSVSEFRRTEANLEDAFLRLTKGAVN
jgi:ABC-2 type transport system ATP-binding protein